MESMTGYAFLEMSTDQFSCSVELKSLNSRYLDIFINLPKILKYEENEIHELLKTLFRRGKLELTVDIFDWIVTKPVGLNAEVIQKYYKELSQIRRKLGIAEPLRFESILSMDGVSYRERSVLTRKSRNTVYGAIRRIAAKTIQMRKREGAAVAKDVNALLHKIEHEISNLKGYAKNIAKEKMEMLVKRIEALRDSKIDDSRLHTECAILADRIDINEEIIRFEDHLGKCKLLLRSDDQIGKKLDFLGQEMFREINTMGSKSNSSDISHVVVEIKNYIEMIREHSRNIV